MSTKTKGPKTKFLSRSLFQGPQIALCCNEEQFFKLCKQAKIEPTNPDWRDGWMSSEYANATVWYTKRTEGDWLYIVCMELAPDRPYYEVCGLLVHEATHIKQQIMGLIGEKNPSPEFEAYMMQCISQGLIDSYMQQMVEAGHGA